MAGLFGLLDMGAGSIGAANAAAATTGRNIANVNTPGYTEETTDLSSLLAGGVMASSPQHVDDSLLAGTERDAASASGTSSSLSSALSGLETALSDSNASISTAMGGFFGNVQSLESSPTDTALRTQVVSAAQALATQLSSAAANVASAQSDSDSRVASYAKQANALAVQIASANKAIKGSPDPTLVDSRNQAAQKLAGLVGGRARIDPDGQMRFVLANGSVLVDGASSATISAAPSTALGGHEAVSVSMGGLTTDVTSSLDGGQIAGEVSFRDGSAQTTANRLDQLAYDVSTAVNAVHSTYAGADGVSGRNLFHAPTTVTGAAAAMSVNAVIVADPSKLGVQAVGAGSSDNSGATALAALASASTASGGTKTMTDEAIGIVGDVGAQAQTAKSALSLATSRSDAIASMRDSLSGVSTEDELSALNKIQAASQAATKFVSTINSMLDDLITNL